MPTSSALNTWLIWTAGFVAFPLAGLAGTAVAGRVDGPFSALVGGTVAGLVVGVGQVLASRGRLDPRRWVPATALGMGGGLMLAAANSNYGTALGDLALMGLVTGMVLGIAQSLALPPRTHGRWLWATSLSVLWTLGWIVSVVAITDVDKQYPIFGVLGALVFCALSGWVLERLLPFEAFVEAHPDDAHAQASA